MCEESFKKSLYEMHIVLSGYVISFWNSLGYNVPHPLLILMFNGYEWLASGRDYFTPTPMMST